MEQPDPFTVLGVSRDAPISEIEATYRLLLRAHHPDLHHADGPEVVARAEMQTRQLNEAMGRIRTAHDHASRHDGGRMRWRTTDGWSNRTGHQEEVPCPYCGLRFGRLTEFTVHLDDAHQMHQRQFGGNATRRSPTLLSKIRYIPAWLVLILLIFMIMAHAPAWAFYSVALLFAAVLWAQGSAAKHRRH